MWKVTGNMKPVCLLRGGWDWMEDEDFLYLVDGDDVIASFSASIDINALKRAVDVIAQKHELKGEE